MTSVEFEQLLSYRPSGVSPHCLRDFVFDFYYKIFSDTDKASVATKEYTDKLYHRFVEGGL